jgi:SP family arabinose:H+ symporter-like MFS transporter
VISRKLAVSAMAGASCGLLFGYDIGAISSATQELRVQFALSPSRLGVAVSAALYGTIIGSLAAGFIGDALDRRRNMLVSALLYLFGMVGCAFASSFERFVLFRFLCGIAIGLISVVAPMYLAEIAPSRLRGRLVGGFQINVGIGVVLAFGWSYLISRHLRFATAWRYTLASGAVLALIQAALVLQASRSPRWLALKRRFAEARTVLAALGSADPDGDEASLMVVVDEAGAWRQSSLFSRRYSRPIFLAVSIAIFNQLTGVNVLLYYILDVFTELGSGRLSGRKDAIFVAATSLVATMIAVSMIDKVGRKPLLLAGSAGMGACLLLLPAIRPMHWPSVMVVVILVCYNSFFAFSQGTVIWVYLSEIFPLPVRARGQSLGSNVHWVANAVITGSFPLLASNLGSKVFTTLAAIMAVQFFVILFLYPETKQIGLEAVASFIHE